CHGPDPLRHPLCPLAVERAVRLRTPDENPVLFLRIQPSFGARHTVVIDRPVASLLKFLVASKVIHAMKDWTIRRRIWTSFAVILALMTVTATIAYTRLARIEQLTNGIEANILPRLNCGNQIMVERMANYSLTQEYVLETDVSLRTNLQAAILTSRAYMETLAEQYGGLI